MPVDSDGEIATPYPSIHGANDGGTVTRWKT